MTKKRIEQALSVLQSEVESATPSVRAAIDALRADPLNSLLLMSTATGDVFAKAQTEFSAGIAGLQSVRDRLKKRLSQSAPMTLQSRQLDPKLMRIMARRKLGVSKPAAASAGVDEIAVVAITDSLDAWTRINEVKTGESFPLDNGQWVVTGRVPVLRADAVRSAQGVIALRPAKPVRSLLWASRADMKAEPENLPADSATAGGEGVVVAVVDFGCDFVHSSFRNADGSTRLEYLWNQAAPPTPGPNKPVKYGRLYTREEINRALTSPDPYAALGYRPRQGSHGTHVLDIAAGSLPASPGIAPNATLIFVELSTSDIDRAKPEANKNLGDSVLLLEAVRFCFEKAGDRPCVVNLSLGSNGGPHDGTTPVERGLDQLCTAAPNRAVVIAAGNAYEDGIHAAGTFSGINPTELLWETGLGDQTPNEMEIWYEHNGFAGSHGVRVIDPEGDVAFAVEAGGKDGSYGDQNELQFFVAHNLPEDDNPGVCQINLWMAPELAGGTWKVVLESMAPQPTPFHAWIERDDYGQSTFGGVRDNSSTLGSISCGQHSIVVGAYNAHEENPPAGIPQLAWFSSSGPTRDGRYKPEVSAPGQSVEAANALSGGGIIEMSGTSMAAPAVAGAIALAFAEGRRRQLQIPVTQLRELVERASRPVGDAWDARYGHGRLSSATLVAEVVALGGNPLPPAAQPVPIPAASTKKVVQFRSTTAGSNGGRRGAKLIAKKAAQKSPKRVKISVKKPLKVVKKVAKVAKKAAKKGKKSG